MEVERVLGLPRVGTPSMDGEFPADAFLTAAAAAVSALSIIAGTLGELQRLGRKIEIARHNAVLERIMD